MIWPFQKKTPEHKEEHKETPQEAGTEDELEKMNTRLVLSQIGPHFIFNVLNTIYYLCEKDTAIAQEAISDFSSYLMTNLDLIKREEPIPFSEELEHIERYLDLERLRYGEELNVEYNIHEKDFCLPALSVQAIVENAVRHGIGKKENGGTLRISSFRGWENYCVEVYDDGDGFDPDAPMEEGRSHIGIQSVRYLLKVMCGGSLSYISGKGDGTHAMIRIPVK